METSNLLNSIECFHKTTTNFITGTNPPYHRHEGIYEFYLYLQGNAVISVETDSFHLTEGDLLLVRPGELHRCVVNDATPYERVCVNLPETVIQNLSSPTTSLFEYLHSDTKTGFRIAHLSFTERDSFVHLTDEFITLSSSDEYGSDLAKVSCMISFLLLVNQIFSNNSGTKKTNLTPTLVKNIMYYIEAHLTAKITLSDLSRELGYSGNYLSSVFKKHTGLTLRNYILDQKIEAAKSLLLSGHSVSEACSLAGFNDYANFIRSFKQSVGISPKKYRNT